MGLTSSREKQIWIRKIQINILFEKSANIETCLAKHRKIRVFLLVTVKQRLKKRCISVTKRFNNFSSKILQVEARIFIAMFGFVVETLNYSITLLYQGNLINKTKKFSSYR